jgi:hypothetical protein
MRLEALNGSFIYDMSYFEQGSEVSWESVLDEIDSLDVSVHNDAKQIISESDGLKTFISQVNLDRNKEIMKKCLSYMIALIAKEGIDSAVVAEMIGATGNCATPVNDLVMKYYALAMQAEGMEIPENVMMRLAIDYAIKSNKVIKNNEVEGQEKKEYLIDFLMNRNMQNMPKVEKLDHVSNHTRHNWVDNAKKEELLKLFCKTDKNALIKDGESCIWDNDKYNKILANLKKDVLCQKDPFLPLRGVELLRLVVSDQEAGVF